MNLNIWKTMIVALVGVFGIFLSSCSNLNSTKLKKVEGEVFIVTKGSDNIKLGLVKVIAVSEETFESLIKNRETEIKATIEKTENSANDCNEKINKFRGGAYKDDASSLMQNCLTIFKEYKDLPGLMIDSIPQDSPSTVTNADGKFSFNLPDTGKYTILAKGKRMVGQSEEKYFWLATADTSKDNQNIILSNNNLVEVIHMKALFKAY